MVPNALEKIEEIKELAVNKEIALFLDYDGTLTPIVSHPDQAVLSQEMRKVMKKLMRYYTVAIISGRDRPNVEKMVNLMGIFYAGSHGFDIAGPGRSYEYKEAEEYLPILDQAEEELKKAAKPIDGAWVERKKYSVALHFRQVSDRDEPKVEPAFDAVLSKFPKLRKSSGKKVFELQPKLDWNKGKALLWLIDFFRLNRKDVVPIYIGDDRTDEDAFKVLKKRGLGIVVHEGNKETAASYQLKDPLEVQLFFERLIHG